MSAFDPLRTLRELVANSRSRAELAQIETQGTLPGQLRSLEERSGRPVMIGGKIVAVGLLTKRDVELLGPTFDRLWPVEDAPCFSELLQTIDEADRTNNSSKAGSTGLSLNHLTD